MSITRLAAATVLSLAAFAPAAPVTPVAATFSPDLPEGRHGGYVARPEPAHDHASHTHTHAPRVAPVRAAAAVRRVFWDGKAFATPEAAMRFLAAAYNAHDDIAIRHVTTPESRKVLLDMRHYAPALRLDYCRRAYNGTYDCKLTHTLADSGEDGYMALHLAPAARPGWYVRVMLECGDGEME